MSCKTLKLNSCEILGSTFSGRTFNFPDRDISQDKFTAKVKGFAVTNANEVINGVVAGSSVFFSKDSLSNLKSGRYVIEYWADFKDVANEMIALEEFLISTTPCACTDDSLIHDFTLEFPTETIEYSVKSETTNIYLDFEDLTPEQILELQKPALEVIEQTEIALAKSILATESSIEATSSSVLATEKSVLATENAVNATLGLETLRENVELATTNANANAQLALDASNLANEKAGLADNASVLANEKAELADTATQNANTATTNANNATNEAVTATQNAILATEKAENAKGWTPIFIDVSDGVRVVRKLDKYIGGTGTAPTENVGKYLKSDGTYTDVIAQAIDYKGPQFNGIMSAIDRAQGLELSILNPNNLYFWKSPSNGMAKGGVAFLDNNDVYFHGRFDTRLIESDSTANNQLELIFSSTNFMPITVYWGDGTKSEITTYNSPLLKKNYATAGIYSVLVVGSSFSFYWNNVAESRKLIGIVKNGNNIFIPNSFYGCGNNESIGDDCNLLNEVTNGTQMFRQNAITALPSGMTLNNLTNGNTMFYQNQLTTLPSVMTLNNLTDGNAMFRQNSLTALPSGMTLNNLTNGNNMFLRNQLTTLPSVMTLNNLTDGNNMFRQNSLTALPSGMTLNNLTNGSTMFLLNTLDTTRYSKLLVDMNNLNVNQNVVFHGGSSKYNSTAIASRENLVNVKKWTITDGGLQN